MKMTICAGVFALATVGLLSDLPASRANEYAAEASQQTQINIGRIRSVLRLTSEQERYWPAVEAALRNIAYTRTRDAHRRGAPTNTAQLAVAEPDAADVQGLKSAAIPLIMSFNAEQKDEVRSLAHVMGLDQLASQF